MKTMDSAGRNLIVNGRRLKPKEFFGVDAFMFWNWALTWVRGSKLPNGTKIDAWGAMREIIEQDVLALGAKWMRAPIEGEGWDPPYFNHPDYPNQRGHIQLDTVTGSRFALGPELKKLIRLYVLLAREYGIIIQIPIIWTLKEYIGGRKNDPRLDLVVMGKELEEKGIGVWNEHFVANVLRYATKLRLEGDGEGNLKVDPGTTNLYFSAVNEWSVTPAIAWTKKQMVSIIDRARQRHGNAEMGDLPGELFSLSSSEPYDQYPLDVPNDASHVEIHPPRGGNFAKQGAPIRDVWPQQLVIVDESNMLWSVKDKNEWVKKIAKWASLGTTDADAWARMHENFWAHDIYSEAHTFPHMSVRWHRSTDSAEMVRKTIMELTGATVQPPPPPPPPPGEKNPLEGRLELLRQGKTRTVVFPEGLWPVTLKGGNEKDAVIKLAPGGGKAKGQGVLRGSWNVLFDRVEKVRRFWAFVATDRGDIVEITVSLYARGGPDGGSSLSAPISIHKESPQASYYDAYNARQVGGLSMKGVNIHVECRVNGQSENVARKGTLTARPHVAVYLELE